MKIIIHPTWACQFHCPYCSVHAQGLERDKRTLSVARWGWFIRQAPPASTFEISGGEPLLYPAIIDLLRIIVDAGHLWGMTTNAAHARRIEELIVLRISGCLALNVSIHPESPPDLGERATRLAKAGYAVHINRVMHPASPPAPTGLPLNNIPYQPWAEGMALDGIRRVCTAGVDHLCCDPAGNVYRCLVDLQLGNARLGTINDPLEQIRLKGPALCDHGCSTCYTDDPGAWHISMGREGA